MKRIRLTLGVFVLLLLGIQFSGKAQTIELLAGNTLNGAMNGVLLGGATMALQNSNDIAPVRIGLGLGTLYGIGVGAYDLSTVSIGNQFYISGTFNDGTNSSIIVLLDTFYGAAAGAVISTSVSLIANTSIVDGLQYGTSVGAWIGFGFGLIDSFTLANRHHMLPAQSISAHTAEGLIRFTDSSDRLSLGLINPSVFSQKIVTNKHIGLRYTAGVKLVNLSVKL